MSVSRLQHITKIGVEQMGDLADSLADPDVLRILAPLVLEPGHIDRLAEALTNTAPATN